MTTRGLASQGTPSVRQLAGVLTFVNDWMIAETPEKRYKQTFGRERHAKLRSIV